MLHDHVHDGSNTFTLSYNSYVALRGKLLTKETTQST